MQPNEIQQRFQHAQETIHRAAERCQTVDSLPMDLKNSIQQLDQKAMHATKLLQSQDENQIRQCVDDLEQLGDQAKDACESASASIDSELRDAVMQAHRELSDLKHQLH
jgi:DNA-binding ferritin-like protein